ncbi:MAG: ABC transporter permease [Gammaproteobacteria bacterium]|nr:MAG: ABC transporter permease [Gammaproteobacteria bacterium]
MKRLFEYRVAYSTILVKEVRRFLRIWMQTVLPAVISTSLYFLIFGHLIGERIGDMEGYRYIDFIVPGVILMAIINNAYGNVVSSFFSAKFQRHVEELLVSPMPNHIILLGFVSGGIARGVTVGLAVTAVAALLSDLQVHNLAVVLLVAVLTAALFAIAGLINAIYAKSFDDISIIPTFVLTPLIYLGGIFYSLEMLPEFWRGVSLFNPILYMINAFRYGFIGSADIGLGTAFAIIGLFIVALYLFALHLLNRGVGIRS